MTVPELEALEKKMLAPMQADKAGGQRHRAAEASGAELIAPILLILFWQSGRLHRKIELRKRARDLESALHSAIRSTSSSLPLPARP